MAGLTLDRDVAAHHLTKATANSEAEARATVFARCSGGSLGELLEQLTHLLRRHADACVGHRDGDPVTTILVPLPRVDGEGAVVGELVVRLSSAWRNRIWSACSVPIPASQWTAT